MNEHISNVIIATLDFAGRFIWPAVLLIVIFKFRTYIEALLTRLGSLKIAGSEWVFQPSTDKEVKTNVIVEHDKLEVGPDGFFSSENIRKIVQVSGLIAKDDVAKQELLIFQTPRQRTWLVATKNYVFVLLDDDNTKKRNDLIQTYFEKPGTMPLKFNSHDGAGTVKFNAENIWWYYSYNLYPTTTSLTNAVERLIQD